MRRKPTETEAPTYESSSAERRVRQILLDGVREVYLDERDVDEPEPRRISWANYGETQPVPEDGEPPEPYRA